MAHLRHGHLHIHHDLHIRGDGVPVVDIPVATELEVPTPVEVAKRSETSDKFAPAASETSGDKFAPSASETAKSKNCDGKDDCTKGPSSATIAISVSVIVPVVLAIVLFVYLHRRHQKKLRLEDANDPHKSYDFGIDPSLVATSKSKKGRGKNGPEMASTTNNANLARSLHGRGLSMDIGGSPYLIPPELQGSRESLHSLSRTLGNQGHDPYRPATFHDSATTPSIHTSRFEDDSSTRTGSTARTGGTRNKDGMNQNLLRNAQRMSQSGPPPPITELPDATIKSPPPAVLARKGVSPPQASTSPAQLDAPKIDINSKHESSDMRRSNNYLANFIHSREASLDATSRGQSPVEPPHAMSPPPRGQSLKSPIPQISIEHEFPGSNLGEFNEIVVPPPEDAASRSRGGAGASPGLSSPDVDVSTPFYTPTEAVENPMNQGLGVSDVEFGNSNRLSILRPLPPDHPEDNPEQRANRIRSFYKEYFNDGEAHAYQAGANYYEDYGSEFMGDATVFDPSSGQFVVAQAPYAEPVTRRAMTPPPRGPPRKFIGPGHASPRGSPMPPRGRAFSTASTSRLGPGARPPQKRAPPPKDLRTLPTPHLLKEDAFALPIDFAPPKTYKDRAAGRPQSPFIESRPFSPQVAIASPLVSSFNDLPAMPSPHLLRKSGTFTALDFAPPPKFRNEGSGSDAGSIRSGRSGHSVRSQAQVHNIRAGTYRLSRIPAELVGTPKDFQESLKPQWKLGN